MQKGRQLVLKLKEVQEENMQLSRELQGQDATLQQLELQGSQLAEVQTAAKQLLAHNRMLQLQVEDAIAQAAALRKVWHALNTSVGLPAVLLTNTWLTCSCTCGGGLHPQTCC